MKHLADKSAGLRRLGKSPVPSNRRFAGWHGFCCGTHCRSCKNHAKRVLRTKNYNTVKNVTDWKRGLAPAEGVAEKTKALERGGDFPPFHKKDDRIRFILLFFILICSRGQLVYTLLKNMIEYSVLG